MDARTVAMIARAVSEDEATALIEQYGCMVASVAAVKATKDALDRCLAITQQAINAPLTREQCEDISRRSTTYLHECFTLEAERGILIWKVRPRSHFRDNRSHSTTNAKLAGKLAGTRLSTGYLSVGFEPKHIQVHRIIWAMHTGAWPVAFIDHINGDKADNRVCNLREATRSQNEANKPVNSRNKFGLKGVSRHGARYVAQIQTQMQTLHLGVFDTPEMAHEAYCRAARKYHREFAGGLYDT